MGTNTAGFAGEESYCIQCIDEIEMTHTSTEMMYQKDAS